MALRWSGVNVKPSAVMVSIPEPPEIWNAVLMSLTVKIVPVAWCSNVKPLTELCDKSSVASDVISRRFVS